MADEITLDEDLYDRRDPSRPAIFIAPRGAKVSRVTAEALGLKAAKPAAVKAVREIEVEDKAVKPAATKSARAKKA